MTFLTVKQLFFCGFVGAGVGWCYSFRHLDRYEMKLREGAESLHDLRRTMHGMRFFAFCTVVCLAIQTLAS